MDAHHLLAEVQARGVFLDADGDRLRFSPPGSLPEDLREELRAHRGEVLELLRNRPTVANALPGKVQPTHWPVTDAELLALPLDDFARAGLVVRVWSSVLGERVIFASDNARIDPGEGLPVYRAAELRELLGLGPEELRQVHRVKGIFGGWGVG